MKRKEFGMDAATELRLAQLVQKLELSEPAIIRMAIRLLAERSGLEPPTDAKPVA
jgi:hypothetical protein